MKDTRGSIWRKWDLHIHSNASDGEMNPEQIIAKAKELQLDVIALTDHHTAKNIDEILRLGDENNIAVLPGVEFRTEYGARSVHIIGLFPRVYEGFTVNTQAINELILNPLEISETRIIQKGREKLIEDGNSNPTNEEAFSRGIFEVQVSFKDASEKIHKKLGGIVIVHAGDKSNSLEREMRHEGKVGVTLYNSLGPVKEELMKENFIDICEITDADDNKDFYLEKFNKPSICSSDAHNLSKIGTKFTWIKADPTFEGLKQILYEPECRVKIQENNPELDSPKLRIDRFEIQSSDRFPIVNESIPFNRDLVCIIGGRGSGKSALLESMAYCFGVNKGIDEKSPTLIPFINYFQNNDAQADFVVSYNDLDNKPKADYTTTLKMINVACPYPILYLSQNQVEGIATDEKKLHNLAFESVIKNSTNAEDINSIQREIESLVALLNNMNGEIQTVRKNLQAKGVDELKAEKNKTEKEIELLESDSTRLILSELQTKGRLRNQLLQTNNLLNSLDSDIKSFDQKLQNKLTELNSLLSALGIQYNIAFNFDNLQKALESTKAQLEGLNIISDYNKTMDKAKSELKGKIDVSIEYIEGLKSRVNEISESITSYEKDNKYYQSLIEDRIKHYNKIYLKFEEFKVMYIKAISDFMSSNYEIVQSLRLEPVLSFDYKSFISKLYEYVDKRKIKTLQKFEEVLGFDGTSISEFIEWLKDFSIENSDNPNKFDIFYSWPDNNIDSLLFTNYLSVKTKIEYKISEDDYKPIDRLSLGQKGTVILKLFLSVGNNCPIIIDQPEDHLDNDFIYKDLVKTFRKAKKKRQIIVSTHNANLVVNGDAEQVIIAKYEDEKITHTLSGSIENEEIRERIAELLEGGYDAFKKREEKYHYSK